MCVRAEPRGRQEDANARAGQAFGASPYETQGAGVLFGAVSGRVPRPGFPEVVVFAPSLRSARARNPYETQGAGVLFGPPVLIAS